MVAEREPVKQQSFPWSLVVAVNNDAVLTRTLLASPALSPQCQVISKRGFDSAGKAYNAGLAEAHHELVVFAHQDVYLPATWKADLDRALEQLTNRDPNWGVLGVFGTAKSNRQRRMKGFCYSTGLKTILGGPFEAPVEAESLDELLLVIRRSSGLRFDERNSGFHLYGTDICLEAETRKMTNYIVSAFCIHNSNRVTYLPSDFWRSYLYLRRKWWQRLPVTTCCTTITKGCTPLLKQAISDVRQAPFRKKVTTRCEDVQSLYRTLAQESLHGL